MQKVTLAFGLVTVPVKISTAARGERVGFHMLHEACKSRINQHTYCPVCDVNIERSATVSGYEVAKGEYVVIDAEDLKAIRPESSDVMEITSTVDMTEIDPVMFEASYFLEPEPAGKRAYKLLLTALKKEKKAAVARVTMSGREHVVIIRVCGAALMFHKMYYADEINEAPVGNLEDVEVKASELQMARTLVASIAEPFEHGTYKDEYRAQVLALVEAKRTASALPSTKKKAVASMPAPDLESVLAASIASAKKKGKKSA